MALWSFLLFLLRIVINVIHEKGLWGVPLCQSYFISAEVISFH